MKLKQKLTENEENDNVQKNCRKNEKCSMFNKKCFSKKLRMPLKNLSNALRRALKKAFKRPLKGLLKAIKKPLNGPAKGL